MSTRNWFNFSRKARTSEKSRAQSPRSRSLRLENLEDRALLSVTPLEYAAIRETYSELNLPAEYGDVNVIELTDLSTVALQAAFDEAASTTAPDVICVDASKFDSNTIELNDETLKIDIQSENGDSVSLVSVGDERLKISVSADKLSFDVRSGVVQWGGVDFVDVESVKLTYCLTDSLAIDAPSTRWTTQDVAYYSVDGADITEQYSEDYLLNQAFETINAVASVRADAESNGLATNDVVATSDAVSASDDYAVIFIGGYNAYNNHKRYYNTMVSFYSQLVSQHELAGENIYILYADGDTTGTSLNRNIDGVYTTSNMNFATSNGSSIYAATADKLNEVFSVVAGRMTAGSHLLFYTYDHGSGVEGNVDDYNDYLCGWGEDVPGATVASALGQVKTGFVTCAFGQCFSGGALDDVLDPATGSVVIPNYDGNATFYGMAATNHYEYSWTGTYSDGSNGGFIQSFATALSALDETQSLFAYAKSLNPFTADETYENNKGVSTDYAEHPWGIGESFTVFSSKLVDGDDEYEPNDALETATELGTLAPMKEITAIAGAQQNVDWYKFSISDEPMKNSRVEVFARYAVSSQTISVALYDASGEVVSASKATSESQSISLEGLDPGTYYLKIQNDVWLSEGGVAYVLKALATTSTANLTFFQPAGWSDSVVVASSESSTTSEQTFSYEDEIFVRCAFTTSKSFVSSFSVALYVDTIYKTSWEYVGVGAGKYRTTGDSGYSLGKLTAGNHVVKFVLDDRSELDECDETDNVKIVNFKVVAPSSIDDEYEPNDAIADASDLGCVLTTKTISNLIAGAANNRDWYKFTIDSEGNADSYVELEFVSGENADVDLRLCDGWGNVLVSPTTAEVGGKTTRKISLEGLAAGTYYLEAYNKIDASPVGYTLTIAPPAPTTRELEQSVAREGGSATFDLAADGFVAGTTYCIVARDEPSWIKNATLQCGDLTYTVGKQTTFTYSSSSQPLVLTVECSAVEPGVAREYAFDVKLNNVIGDDFAKITVRQELALTRVGTSTSAPQVGKTISTTLYSGSTKLTEATATYQWYRVAGSKSGEATAIEGATGASYAPVEADAGYYLRVVATGTGAYTGTVSATHSAATFAKLTRVGTSTSAPQVGKTISTTLYSGSTKLTEATATYQWSRVDADGVATTIEGATDASYTPVEADAGYYLRVVATGTGAYKGTVSTTHSAATFAKLTRIGTSTSAPQVGKTISTTLYSGSTKLTEATATYQWYRVAGSKSGEATAIEGATDASYTPVAADAGYYLRVVATGVGSYRGTVSTTHSAATFAALTRIGTSTSKPTVGVEITTTLYSDSTKLTEATATYQWYRVDAQGAATAIEGATNSAYTPTTEDVGYRLRVVAKGTGSYRGTVSATHSRPTVAGESSAVLDVAFAAFDWADDFGEF